MAYRVIYKGLEVICDTLQDVDNLAAGTTASSGSRQKRPYTKRAARTAKGWAKAVKKKQREMLVALATSHPMGLSDNDIRQKLQLENNRKIAGLMGGLSKAARRLGLEIDNLIVREATRNGTGERHYKYGIAPDAIGEVKEGLGIEH